MLALILYQLKLAIKRQLQLLKFYRKTGLLPPRGFQIPNIDNVTISKESYFGDFTQLICQDPENGSEIIVGKKVATNSGVIINADNGGKIYIDDYVLIGPNVIFRAANHLTISPDLPFREQGHAPGIIHVKKNSWIGANSIILPDVTIGEGSVIGAGSVVNRSIPDFSLAAGVPAKVIKTLK